MKYAMARSGKYKWIKTVIKWLYVLHLVTGMYSGVLVCVNMINGRHTIMAAFAFVIALFCLQSLLERDWR